MPPMVGRAGLVLVLGAAVLLAEDGLAAAHAPEDPDRDARPDQRDHHGQRARDESAVTGPTASSRIWPRAAGLRAAGGPRPGRRRARTRSPIVCVVSWPLPAISTTSPRRRPRKARAMAVRRSGSTSRRVGAPAGTPDSTAAMMAAGSSLRGLSEVTTATSARAGRGGAHGRPLGGVAVAAAAEHHEHPACGGLAGRRQGLGQAVGRVGVVDDHGEGLAGVDRLEAAGHRRGGRRARRPRWRRRCRAATAAVGGREGVGHVEPAAEAAGAPRWPRQREAGVVGRHDRRRGRRPARRQRRDRRGVEEERPWGSSTVHHAELAEIGLEQARLGREVALLGAVEVEVVAAEVGEHGHGEARARRRGAWPARATTPPSRRRAGPRHGRRPAAPAARAPPASCGRPRACR